MASLRGRLDESRLVEDQVAKRTAQQVVDTNLYEMNLQFMLAGQNIGM